MGIVWVNANLRGRILVNLVDPCYEEHWLIALLDDILIRSCTPRRNIQLLSRRFLLSHERTNGSLDNASVIYLAGFSWFFEWGRIDVGILHKKSFDANARTWQIMWCNICHPHSSFWKPTLEAHHDFAANSKPVDASKHTRITQEDSQHCKFKVPVFRRSQRARINS